jgi:hypothetical protein
MAEPVTVSRSLNPRLQRTGMEAGCFMLALVAAGHAARAVKPLKECFN